MELRHLRYFIAVAEERHITRAAERLGMQQPPLSQQIKAIERELSVQLFHRKARGVELTDAGRALLADARDIIADLDHALESTRRAARGEQGHICVGVTPTCMYHPFVPQVIRAFREAFPQVLLTLEEHRSTELFKCLANEQIDAAFVRIPPPDPKALVIDELLEEPMVVALPMGHPLAQRKENEPVPLRALANETFIVYGGPHGAGIHAVAFRAFQAAGFNPAIGQQVPHPTSTLNLVAVGLGVTFVPASIRRMNMDGVAYRRLKGRVKMKAALNLASRRGEHSLVVRNIRNLAKKAAQNFSDE